MRLPSFFRRSQPGRAPDRVVADAPLSPDETVAALRTRARRRLIGATVLVAAAVVCLPWLFESQPRPLPPDLAVELAGKDAPATPPADNRGSDRAPAQAPVAADPPPPAASLPASTPDQPPQAPDVDVSRGEAPPIPAPATAPRPPARGSHAVTPSASAPDAARARALLDGKAAASPPAPTGVRYIVQLGAYAEAEAVASARGKAERLGLKTYTQVVDAPAGRRTRVRVGPYASKGEADRAVSQLRSAGLAAVVLTLGG